jgi:hypothetical protein
MCMYVCVCVCMYMCMSMCPCDVHVCACDQVQRAFRAFLDRRIFQYFRNLIRHRERGDASLLLKALGPQEAHLAVRLFVYLYIYICLVRWSDINSRPLNCFFLFFFSSFLFLCFSPLFLPRTVFLFSLPPLFPLS